MKNRRLPSSSLPGPYEPPAPSIGGRFIHFIFRVTFELSRWQINNPDLISQSEKAEKK